MSHCADWPGLGHVHNERGKCECGDVVDLVCGICGRDISASEFDRGERCNDCASPVFRDAYLTGRREPSIARLYEL